MSYKINPFELAIGQRIIKIMEERDIRVGELADAVEVKPSSMSRYLNGASVIHLTIFVKIAKELNVSADYLLGLDEQKAA